MFDFISVGLSVVAIVVSIISLIYSVGLLPTVIVNGLGVSVQNEYERVLDDNSKLKICIANTNNRDLLLFISGFCIIEGHKYNIDEQYHHVKANSLNAVFLEMDPAGDKICGTYEADSKSDAVLYYKLSKHGRLHKYKIKLTPSCDLNGKPIANPLDNK